ncbi:MAG TPA: hypothetical protein PKK06_16785 [Phycisphaerae bacterium]|nr:hypothetical protein [Phycisphaerae bacterium]HNU46844.1 hypothetical protein [Phycisphaerae bacterium]
MPDQKLTLKAEVTGADQAAQEVQRLDAAVKHVQQTAAGTAPQTAELRTAVDGVADASKDAKGPLEGIAVAEQKAAVTGEQWAVVLNRLMPGLGSLAISLHRVVGALGEAGNAEITFTGIAKKLSEAVAGNADAMKLLGAGTAAYLAVRHLQQVWAGLKDEVVATSRAVADFANLQSSAQARAIALQEDLGKAIDATGKAVDAQTRKAAARAAERLTAGGADRAVAIELTAGLVGGGLLGGEGGADADQRLPLMAQILAAGGHDAERLRRRMQRGDRTGIEALLRGSAGRTAAVNLQARERLDAEIAASALSALRSGVFMHGWALDPKLLAGLSPAAAQTTSPTAGLEREIGRVAPEVDAGTAAVKLVQLQALLANPESAELLTSDRGRSIADRADLLERLNWALKEKGITEQVTSGEIAELHALLRRVTESLERKSGPTNVHVTFNRTSYDRHVVAPGGRPQSGLVVGEGRKASRGD